MEKKIRKIADALCEKINNLEGWTAKYNITEDEGEFYTNFMFQHYDKETGTETLVGDLVDSDVYLFNVDTEDFSNILSERIDVYEEDEGYEYSKEQLQLISDLFDNINFFL